MRTEIRCGRNHIQRVAIPWHCGRHPHQLFICPVRVGPRPCGQQTLVPELNEFCSRDPEDG